MKHTVNPADGERRAMVGYVPQYQLAADFIYGALLEGTLEWIRIADPEAGQVDDIQIAAAGFLDAFQVKWSKTVSSVSFQWLTKDEKSAGKQPKPNLMRQLAEGWQKLAHAHPDYQVRVHLVARHVPSIKAKIPLADPQPLDAHFQGFLNDCWQDKSWIRKEGSAFPKGWQDAMSALQAASGLSGGEFLHFVEACFLHLQYQLPSFQATGRREEARRVKDIEQIFRLLIYIAGDEKRVIQLTRSDLLQRLGWEDRFRFRFRHEFWVDEKLYQPIPDTIAELQSSLGRYTQGYLALIGTPGSGKSTILTQTLRYKKGCRIVRYYAFVRDETRLGRGEALNFLHDLVLALEQQGIHGQGRGYPESREELLEKFGSQLAELRERWRETNVRTLILIDGLDHIEREQAPERTLLKDLPLPEAVPEGVIFVLGSQKTDLFGLSSRIQTHLREEGRTLVMQPLDRLAVFAIIEVSSLPITPSQAQKAQILQLSDGHPLALSYLVQKLQNIFDREEFDRVLDEANPYQGNIENDYEVYWAGLEEDSDVRNLLALISRLRGKIDLKEVLRWVGETTIKRFMKRARHYFRMESETSWQFFHNSFRQFVLTKTGRNLFDMEDVEQHQKYHTQLADYAADAQAGTPWSWEEIYHRASAGDKKAVLTLGSQENFRNQFFSLRALGDILNDITLCLQASREEHDGLAIIRSFFIEWELRDRKENLQEVDLPRILLELKGVEAARGYVIQGMELRISEVEALKFCKLLVTKGARERARRIFDAAEPIDLLSGSQGVDTTLGGNIDQVHAWASVASHFRSFSHILQAINQLSADPSGPVIPVFNVNAEETTQYIKRSTLTALADGVFENGNAEELQALREILKTDIILKDINLHLDIKTCLSGKDNTQKIFALNRILDSTKQSDVDDEIKLLIAEFLFHIKGDEKAAERWIRNCSQPPPFQPMGSPHEWENLSPLSQRIRLNRMRSALGNPVDPVIAVPDADKKEWQGAALFERRIVLLANLWGQAWRGKTLSGSEIMHKVYPALILFNRHHRETIVWYSWYEFEGAAPDYFAFLIHAVSAHGDGALEALAEAFDDQWESQATRHYWKREWRRRIALELYRSGDSVEMLKNRLSRIEEDIGVWDDVYERVRECSEQTFAWLEAGETQRASALLPKMLEAGFGIYQEKDHRFSLWSNWLVQINARNPEGTEERIRRFTGALVVLAQAGRGSGIQDAARSILETTASWHSGYALEIRSWLLDQHTLHYTAAIEGLVQAALKAPNPPIEIICRVIRHMLIPFQASCPATLLQLVTTKCYQMCEEQKAKDLLQLLVETIEVKALPSERGEYWRNLIKGLRKVDADAAWINEKLASVPKRVEGTDHFVVTLSSGESLTEEDVVLRISSYEDMLSLAEKVKKADYLHWDKVLSPFIDRLDYKQIKTIIERFKNFDIGAIAPALLAKRLAALGHREESQQLAEEALRRSRPGGWGRGYDGGSRLSAIQSLLANDAENGQKLAYEILIDDYLSEYRYPSYYLYSLEELIFAIFKDPPFSDIWNEIEKNIYQSYDFSQADDFPPPPLNIPGEISYGDMLIQLFFIDYAIPVARIRQEVHKALCELICNEEADSQISSQIERLFEGSEEHQIRALALLEAIVPARPDFAEIFSGKIKLLCASPSMTARQMARGLAGSLQIQGELVVERRKQLSPIYRLDLPETAMPDWTIPLESIPEGQPYPDSEDSLEMIRPFQPRFELLAKLSGIPLQNLLARAAMLMKTLSPIETWNKQAEEKLQKWIKAARVDLSYYRLRPTVALQALSHILAELIDAEVVHEADLFPLIKSVSIHDPVLSLQDARQRPSEVNVPNGREMGPYPRKEWSNVAHEAVPSLIDHMEDGRIVLGELSRFVHLDRELPSEYRFTMICHPDWPSPGELREAADFFPCSQGWYASEYPDLEKISKYPSLVIYSHPFQVELGGIEWLAVNPVVPLHLGWQLCPDGIFRWSDASGNIMVESFRWEDGSAHHNPPHHGEVASEGWLVVASKDAAHSISRTIGRASRLGAVLRQYRDRDEKRLIQDFAVCRKTWEGDW